MVIKRNHIQVPIMSTGKIHTLIERELYLIDKREYDLLTYKQIKNIFKNIEELLKLMEFARK